MNISKIEMKDAKIMEQHGFTLLHIQWRRDLENIYPDCSHILFKNSSKNWKTTHRDIVVVIDPDREVREADAEYRNPMTREALSFEEARILSYILGRGDRQFRLENMKVDSDWNRIWREQHATEKVV